MKKFLFLVVFFFSCLVSFSQIEIYGRYTDGGKIEPNINIFAVKKLTEKLSVTGFALVEEKYAEALVGLAYAPVKWCEVGLSTGIEQNPALYRFGGSVWLGVKKFSMLALLEQGAGKENYWYKTSLTYQSSESISYGLIAWRFHGTGVITKFTPKKSGLTFWVLPTYDMEYDVSRLIIGVQIKI